MNHTFFDRQTILVSGLIQYDNEMLVIRSVEMEDVYNDAEYYTVPSWKVPFGYDPETLLKSRLEELLGVFIEKVDLFDVVSFMRHAEDAEHVLNLVYHLVLSKEIGDSIPEDNRLLFLREKDIPAYIFSERIKHIIQIGFS